MTGADKLVILGHVSERARELEPERPHQDGTGRPADVQMYEHEHHVLAHMRAAGMVTWRDEILDHLYAAFAQTGWEPLRERLIEVAASAVNWIADGDRRTERED